MFRNTANEKDHYIQQAHCEPQEFPSRMKIYSLTGKILFPSEAAIVSINSSKMANFTAGGRV
jgi:hypothetical protein